MTDLTNVSDDDLLEEIGRRTIDEAGPPPTKLDELAEKYGTDKGPSDHNYTPLYDERFWLRRYDALTLVEVGIWRGASLRMWRDYFPNATIIGVDRNPPLPDLGDIDVVQAQFDQIDSDRWAALGSHYGLFHIVIDDASHISSKTITTFQFAWTHLAPGGIYVIEDLQTSYDVKNYGHFEAFSNPNVETPHDFTAMNWCKRLADEVNSSLFPEKYRLGYDIASVEFHPNICFITKQGKWSAS